MQGGSGAKRRRCSGGGGSGPEKIGGRRLPALVPPGGGGPFRRNRRTRRGASGTARFPARGVVQGLHVDAVGRELHVTDLRRGRSGRIIWTGVSAGRSREGCSFGALKCSIIRVRQ